MASAPLPRTRRTPTVFAVADYSKVADRAEGLTRARRARCHRRGDRGGGREPQSGQHRPELGLDRWYERVIEVYERVPRGLRG